MGGAGGKKHPKDWHFYTKIKFEYFINILGVRSSLYSLFVNWISVDFFLNPLTNEDFTDIMKKNYIPKKENYHG